MKKTLLIFLILGHSILAFAQRSSEGPYYQAEDQIDVQFAVLDVINSESRNCSIQLNEKLDEKVEYSTVLIACDYSKFQSARRISWEVKDSKRLLEVVKSAYKKSGFTNIVCIENKSCVLKRS